MSEASMGDMQVDAVGNSDSGEDDLLSDGGAGATGDNEEAEVTECCVCTRTFEDRMHIYPEGGPLETLALAIHN